jgi:hypothetical protein
LAHLPNVQIRALDEEKRYAEFVASTEAPVDTMVKGEILLMGGLDLDRFSKNGPVLDAHKRESVGDIIGRAKVWVEGDELVAGVTFAEGTPKADIAWQLTRTGFVNALSIGYWVKSYERVKDGQTIERGGRSYKGPAMLATEWELFEVSPVPVPSNKDTLRRSQESEGDMADERTAPKPDEAPPKLEDRAAKFEARKKEVLARVPECHWELAQDLMMREAMATADGIVDLILKQLQERAAPLGTPEPRQPAGPKAKEGEQKPEPKTAEFEGDVLIKGIRGM